MQHDKLCELCDPRNYRAMRALESLTPSGSEFVNDVERCVSSVRDRERTLIEWVKRDKAKHKALENIGNMIGAPTCDYADAESQVEVLHQRLREVSKLVQEALKH